MAVSCQEQLLWRFSYIPWQFLAAKAILFSGSDYDDLWDYVKCAHTFFIMRTLHQNRIALAAKNRQGKYQNRQGNDPWRPAAKQNPPRIERQ